MISSSSMTRMEPRPVRRAAASDGTARAIVKPDRFAACATAAARDDASGSASVKRVPCPIGAVAGDRAAVLLHDAVGDRQAESGALADLLGREERIVDARELLGRNARTRCRRSRRPPTSPLRRASTIDSQPPFGIASRAFRNRFRNTCCSLYSMPCTTTAERAELLAHLDAAGAELVLEQRQHVVDDGVDVAPGRCRPAPAARGSAGR